MASVNKRGGSWVVRWRDGGRGSRAHQLTRSTERAAQALADEIDRAIERYGKYEPGRRVGPTPLKEIVDGYIADSARRHAPGTTRRSAH